MKIKELLSDLPSKIYLEQSRHTLERLRYGVVVGLEEKAIYFEKKAVLKELEKLYYTHGHAELTAENLKPFQLFLANRWEVIAKTDLAYPYAVKYSMTQLCLYLAEKMAPVLQVHRFKLMMPSLIIQNEVSLTTLDEDDTDAIAQKSQPLQLNMFVLSDDDTYLIHVLHCLQYAKEDRILKHTNQLSNNQKKILSENEMRRVVSHSHESKQFYEAVSQLYAVKVEGENTGGFVRRLIDRLRVAGEHGGRDGTADVAGRDAVAGVKEFYEFLKTFDAEERQQLFSCFATFNTVAMTFELCWMHLLSRVVMDGKLVLPEKELNNMVELLSLNPTNSVPCIELIAQDLERILSNHNELFQLYPKNKAGSQEVAVSMCEDRVKETESLLIDYLNAGKNTVLEKYGSEASERLVQRVFKTITTHFKNLKYVMENVPLSLCRHLLQDVLGDDSVQNIVKDIFTLQAIFTDFKEVSLQSIVLETIGSEYIRKLVKNFSDLALLLGVLQHSQYIPFLFHHLGQAYLNVLLAEPKAKVEFFEKVPASLHELIKNKLTVKDDMKGDVSPPMFPIGSFFALPPASRLAAVNFDDDELDALSTFHL